MGTNNARFLVAGVVALVVLAFGCQDQCEYENFNQVRQNSSTQAEVERLMGKPNQTLGAEWMYERDELTVLVSFDERGTVTRKQWIDHNTGSWEDSAERTTDARSTRQEQVRTSKQ